MAKTTHEAKGGVSKRDLTKARRFFLAEAAKVGGVSAVETYPPAQWAHEHGFVTRSGGRFGHWRHFITPAGNEILGDTPAR